MEYGHLVILGRRWFDKVNGNTYHSVSVYVDGKLVDQQGITYGYDRQYEQTAQELLGRNGYRIERNNYGNEPAWHTFDRFASVLNFVFDVPRKRDL